MINLWTLVREIRDSSESIKFYELKNWLNLV